MIRRERDQAHRERIAHHDVTRPAGRRRDLLFFMVMMYSPGWLWLELVGPVFLMLKLIDRLHARDGSMAVLFSSSPSGIALSGSANAWFVSTADVIGRGHGDDDGSLAGRSGGVVPMPVPGIVAPKQSTIPADSLQVNAPAPGAASAGREKVTPAGRMSRTETFSAGVGARC